MISRPRGGEFEGVLVGIPTYNEASNAGPLLTELRTHLPGATLLVIDDSSPDGTAEVVEAVAAGDPLVRLHRRSGKLGLGTAYLVAFAAAHSAGATVVLTMDADFSHRPVDAPEVVRAALGGADLAIGSRYVPGGAISGWPLARQVLSATANRLIRSAIDTDVADCTGAFRAYRTPLARLIGEHVTSRGYSALPELLMLALLTGARVTEVPITFVERERGATKLTRRELATSLANVVELRRRSRAARRSAPAWATSPAPAAAETST
ncbi:MAG: polyprenol monophosphomannose synthase [Candidatus Dormibacteria bacterium]